MQVDRRRDVRVLANGSVIVHARESLRGRLMDVSSGGMRVRLAEMAPGCSSGEGIEVELHLDRAGATWLRFHGEVVRVDERELAISFSAVPIEFADVIEDALASVLEGAAATHILLVDANTDNRVPFAALLRKTGCRVAESATPLEAISHLGGSAIDSWVVVITDTVPSTIAEELRRFLADGDAPVHLLAIGEQPPTSALAWFVATNRSIAPSRLARQDEPRKDLDVD
jgi:CheY-like chemotaxis protein